MPPERPAPPDRPRPRASPPELSAWGLPAPTSVRRPVRGTNNLVWLLDDTYVLRVYQNLAAARVAAELRLLAALHARGGLPFAVPRPIADRRGRTLVETPDGPAVLFEQLRGRPGARTDLADVELAGEALGRLDRALAELPAELAPVDWRVSLDDIHPAVSSVPDLAAELERLLPGDAGVRWLREHAPAADEAYLRLARQLPTQIIHGDLATSNVLIGPDGRVVAVLDFEVAGLDVRVNDPVAGLAMAVDWGTSRQAAQAAAFRTGYDRMVGLDPAEEEAVPALLQHRALGSVIWRAGRWRQGLADLDDVRERLATLSRTSSAG